MSSERARNAKLWQDHVAAFRASGLSAKSYCRTHKLSTSTLRYWRLRMGEPKCPSRAERLAMARAFVPVSVAEERPVAAAHTVRVVLRDGTVIEGCDLVTVVKLVELLRGRSA